MCENFNNKILKTLGITGNVSIDHNGDRYSDYSLLDLDPKQDKFVVILIFIIHLFKGGCLLFGCLK